MHKSHHIFIGLIHLILLISSFSCTTCKLSEADPPSFQKETNMRIQTYDLISKELNKLKEEELSLLLSHSTPKGNGFRSELSTLEIEGTKIFVKRIPLTETELQPTNFRSTQNLFHLPVVYQYGAGSTGFSAWRELAAMETTTNWVLKEENPHFPILYHWRILPRTAPSEISQEEKRKLEEEKSHWNGSEAVYKKSEEMHTASKELVLFIEYIPRTVKNWIKSQPDTGWAEAEKLHQFKEEILSTLEFMHLHGLYHFDSHLSNILTDGDHIYISDFGLATDTHFALSEEEGQFLQKHKRYDQDLSMTSLCLTLLGTKSKLPDQHFSLTEYTQWVDLAGLPLDVTTFVRKWGPTAVKTKNFLRDLYLDPTKRLLFYDKYTAPV